MSSAEACGNSFQVRDNSQRPQGGADQRVLGLSEWQELGSETREGADSHLIQAADWAELLVPAGVGLLG